MIDIPDLDAACIRQDVSLKLLPNITVASSHRVRMSGLAARLLYVVASYLCGRGEQGGKRGESRKGEWREGGREGRR